MVKYRNFVSPLQLKKLLSELPTLPAVAQQLVSTLNSETSSAEDVARIINSDPPLATRVLKMANSAYYALPRKITTVHDAIPILGFNTVHETVLGVSVFQILEGDTPVLDHYRNTLWKHSYMTAIAAREIAKATPRYAGLAGEMWIAGLIHDVGKIIHDQSRHEQFLEILRLVGESRMTYTEAEKAMSVPGHDFLGRQIARHWRFPPQLSDAINGHHNPTERAGNALHRPYLYMLYMANKLAHHFDAEIAGAYQLDRIPDRYYRAMGLTPMKLSSLLPRIQDEFIRTYPFQDLRIKS